MFSRIATLTLAALPLLAAATPLGVRGGEPPSSCSTGPIQCCNTVEQGNAPSAAAIIALLGLVLQDPTVLVGLTCDPINVIGVGGGGSCNANAVCCQDNSNGGLISIGCVPVEL
ncbi:hypothetical protein V8D89_004511 [Ganoderma adspersum]